MKYLLDTNVISETIKSNPNHNVLDWLFEIDVESFYISVISLGEIRRGIEKTNIDSKKKSKLINWLEQDIYRWFDGQILSVDGLVANKWGFICANAKKTMPALDSLIAATALTHNLKLVTRNVKDFEQFKSLEIINPF